MQRWSGTGLEPVNGTMISWRDTRCWWIHITKPQMGAHTPKASSHIRPSLVPLRHFAQLPLLGQDKPDQGEESGTEPSSCVSCGLSSVEAEGVPGVGEGVNCATFYRIVMLAWRVMNQWLFLPKTLVLEISLQYPAWQGWAFIAFGHFYHEYCFRRCLSDSGRLTFKVSEKS